MKLKFYYQERGSHTHVRVFAGEGNLLGKCGDLTFRNEEWVEFIKLTTGEYINEGWKETNQEKGKLQ